MVIWSNSNLLKTPKVLPFMRQPDFETLRALSVFLSTTPFDATGSLVWPFNHNVLFEERHQEAPLQVSDALILRGEAIWQASHDPITVLCGGDIDSVAVIAALLQTAPENGKLRVHYTDASVQRYPRLFEELLPALGVPCIDRTGQSLITPDVIRYCDGRSGDDFQASYKDYLALAIPEDCRNTDLRHLINHIASHAVGRTENQALAKEGLEKWVSQHPYTIQTPWQFTVHMFRSFYTQSSAWAGILLEDDTQSAFQKRVSFYDAPVFSGVTRYLAETTNWPNNEDIGMKQFVYDFFKDIEWYKTPGLIDIHSVIKPGKISSRWLGADGQSYSYREFESKNF